MKHFLALLTLQQFNISAHRKRMFRTTTLLLLTLILVQFFKSVIFPPIPFLTELLAVAILTTFSNIIFNIIRLFVVSSHRKRRGIANEERDNFTVGVNALVNTATVIAAIIFFFAIYNIEFRVFLSSIALVAVALTIIFQEFIKNFLFGLAMMFSADYEIGDYIQVGNMPKGVILTITFSTVQLKSESGDMLFIPNSVIRAHEVINFSKLKPKRITTEFILLRNHLPAVATLELDLLQHLDTCFPNTFDIPKSYIQIKETNKDEVIFSLEAPTRKASLVLREKVNAAVQKFIVEYKVN